jgi:hypothetical protein
LPHRFRGHTAVVRGKSAKFPDQREKPRICPPL